MSALPFDAKIFEAEVALKLIPAERLPAVAQDAMEAGMDGPYVVQMAILDPKHAWAIDQALPPMLKELGCRAIARDEAATRLARYRAKRILESSEDPLPSIPYFHQLIFSGECPPDLTDYPGELISLAFLDDAYAWATEQQVRTYAREALEQLLRYEPAEGTTSLRG